MVSGLAEKDITARVFVDDDTEKEVEIFQPGTLDQYGKITTGENVIIGIVDSVDVLGKQIYNAKTG